MNVLGLIPLLLVLFIVFACIRTVMRATIVSREHRHAARCGQCSYEIVDLSADRCPECGGALLQVGIVTPSLSIRRRPSTAGVTLAWTVLAFVAGTLIYAVAVSLTASGQASFPFGANSRVRADFQLTPQHESRWDEYAVILVIDVVTDEAATTRSGSIDVEVSTPDGQTAAASMDALTLKYDIRRDGEVVELGSSFDTEAAVTLLVHAGIDASDNARSFEARQIVKLIATMSANPISSYPTTLLPTRRAEIQDCAGLAVTTHGRAITRVPATFVLGNLTRAQAFSIAYFAGWIAFYFVGLRLILRRRRRVLHPGV